MRSIRSLSRLSGFVIALGLAASACGGSDAAETDGADEGGGGESAAPAAAVISNITSETFDLASYTGEDTLFWFWAPW